MSVNAGLATPDRQAFDLTDCNERIAEYLTKYGREPRWTEAEEVTLGLRKEGRQTSVTPWGLLRLSQCGHAPASDLWVEFSEGVKQLNQLRCSPGLKGAAGLHDKTDEDLIEEDGETVREWFTNIPQSIWERVRNKYRAHLLQVASTGNLDGFNDYLTYATLKTYEKETV